jgi:thiol:disulfide interchange protein
MPDLDSTIKGAGAILVVLLAVLFYRMHHSTTFVPDGMDPSWDAAARYSQFAGQPSVVLFTADWCPTCRLLHRDVLSRDDVRAELHSHYSFYKVDLTDPSPRVSAHAQKLSVSGIPLMIRYDANGKETDRQNYLEPKEMIAWLKAGE